LRELGTVVMKEEKMVVTRDEKRVASKGVQWVVYLAASRVAMKAKQKAVQWGDE
jgi:hypothetical protein